MEFHHHGYVSEDPRTLPVAGTGIDRPERLPDEVDVLIVGSGPAGMIAAAQLSMYPNVTTRIIERRPHRLILGQADGIQARSVETFQAFGFADEITGEAYQITEMAFWKPAADGSDAIERTTRTIDDPEGISEFPHLIVNQARVLDYYANYMAKSPTRMKPDYGYEFLDLDIKDTGADADPDYPVHVTVRCVCDDNCGDTNGTERIIRAKYVIGCDGARSQVRKSIGRTLKGDASNHAWGVMDVVATTDFPDIRLKCAIQSRSGGNILLIPREGGHLFRMYVDLGIVEEHNKGTIRDTSIEEIIAKAQAIMKPYTLDVKNVAWHSVYEVGHRLTDKFDNCHTDTDVPRVFITGDACHTHSAKAGQGMNVSMQDGWNIGWKLGQALSGYGGDELLRTYCDERQVVAQDLINFDKEWSTLMATPPEEFEDPSFLEDFYVKTAEFPAGFMTCYQPSLITADDRNQHLAAGYPIGKRFRSYPVTRTCDATVHELGHLHQADGRWRIYVFADGATPADSTKTADWAQWWMSDANSPQVRYTPADGDTNALFDTKVIYQGDHTQVEHPDVPNAFKPVVGPFGLTDYNQSFVARSTHRQLGERDFFDARNIDRQGAIVVVRPDQYVAGVFSLDDTQGIAEFLNPIFASN
ncbi:FAD-dependent monooxygenase [Corynebacterium aquilae]|uniref:Phenol 2-monooxygenase n=1 Tax=Corynebacterium aquilae DSM 44791 TaxID=1431546 RepID=A0A1L7CDK4_9CORY|nr:FAD-dependent monooxygenase [Corynebacterium aquilae]APT83927.1 phenol 2-monooxygenase [Corynebacterium aquilae DSM 44791]